MLRKYWGATKGVVAWFNVHFPRCANNLLTAVTDNVQPGSRHPSVEPDGDAGRGKKSGKCNLKIKVEKLDPNALNGRQSVFIQFIFWGFLFV